MDLLVRIIEKVFLLYFAAYLAIDFAMFLYAVIVFRRKKTSGVADSSFCGHSISIVVPGYNEEVTIVHCLRQLLRLDYPDYDVIFINDGSKDGTLAALLQAFSLHKISPVEQSRYAVPLTTQPVRAVYRTADNRLTIIDKDNSGKADCVNVGINHSTKRYICTVDADSVLDPTSLRTVIVPMIASPETFVTGGQLAAANDVQLTESRILPGRMPRNVLVLWQLVEYIKCFMIAKIGLSRIGALLIMSGAFSVYRRDDLLAVGGFLTQHNDHPFISRTIGCGHHTVCEDMEIVVRLWRYYREQHRRARASFIPNPVCWTEVPEKMRSLFRQRTRWHLGLAETLKIHGGMLFEPRFGTTGMVALPYYFLFELVSPVVKVFAVVYLVIAVAAGRFDATFVALLTLSVLLLTGIFTSTITVIIERWSERQSGSNRDALRYRGTLDWLVLVGFSLLCDFFYGVFKTAAQLCGIVDFLRKKSAWNKFERKGFIGT